uniref:gustatory receptor 79 n=1 Tax=Aedes aegypti TaxID=7159 RepID=UPI000C284BCF|nr:gustatory receptor 79 [Aedes aegypti]
MFSEWKYMNANTLLPKPISDNTQEMEALENFRPFIKLFANLTLQPSLLLFEENSIQRPNNSLQFRLIIKCVFHLIFIIGAIIWTLDDRWGILYADDYNGQILGALSMIVVFLTHGFSIMEISVSLESISHLWNTFQRIENLLGEIGCKQLLKRSLRKCYLKYFIHFFAAVALYVIAVGTNLYISTLENVKLIHLLLIFNGSIALTSLRLALIELHVQILSCYMALINVELRNILLATEYGKVLKNLKYDYVNYSKLKKLNNCYVICSNVLDQIKKTFSISIFWNCLKIKVLILDDIYSIIYQLVRGSLFGENTMLRVPNKVFFINWINSCDTLFRNQLNIIETINAFNISGSDDSLRILVLHLQSTLTHRKFQISSAGMFYVTFGFVMENIINGLTYVTFMVQLTK